MNEDDETPGSPGLKKSYNKPGDFFKMKTSEKDSELPSFDQSNDMMVPDQNKIPVKKTRPMSSKEIFGKKKTGGNTRNNMIKV